MVHCAHTPKSQYIMRSVQEGRQVRNLKAGPLAVPGSIASDHRTSQPRLAGSNRLMLFEASYTIQATYLGNGAAHSGLGLLHH